MRKRIKKVQFFRYYYYCHRLDNLVKFYLSQINNEAELMSMSTNRERKQEALALE